jgi:hypothetical protein
VFRPDYNGRAFVFLQVLDSEFADHKKNRWH